jgi:hypothetical protein
LAASLQVLVLQQVLLVPLVLPPEPARLAQCLVVVV